MLSTPEEFRERTRAFLAARVLDGPGDLVSAVQRTRRGSDLAASAIREFGLPYQT